MTKKEIREADSAFALQIKARDGKCIWCGTTKRLNCHHIISRRNHKYRWDERNAITLCFYHHLYVVHRDALTTMHWILTKQPWIYKQWKQMMKEIDVFLVRKKNETV